MATLRIVLVRPENAANIGAVARHTYNAKTGRMKDFVSGYSNDSQPNLFDRSDDIRDALRARKA